MTHKKLPLVANTISPAFRDVLNIETIEHIKNNSDCLFQRLRVYFKNGYSLSIIKGPYSYGGKQDLFEIAPYDKKDCINGSVLGISGNDILGYCSVEQVRSFIKQIGEFK